MILETGTEKERFERVDGVDKYGEPKLLYHPPAGGINRCIHMGGGNFSEAQCEYLHKRLDDALSWLSGAQQNGLQGHLFDQECDNEATKEIDNVIREITIALGAN